jgi:hypothetical protein
LRSCRDVFTGWTPVKEIEVIADPLVSKLTTAVIGAPLDGTTARYGALTFPIRRA